MDNLAKEIVKNYILNYSNGFVGFLEVLADILDDLGNDWSKVNKQHWADVFHLSASSILVISQDLEKIKEEYEANNK